MHGIEDHLLNQIIKYNGIGCAIKQAHLFEMNDEKEALI